MDKSDVYDIYKEVVYRKSWIDITPKEFNQLSK